MKECPRCHAPASDTLPFCPSCMGRLAAPPPPLPPLSAVLAAVESKAAGTTTHRAGAARGAATPQRGAHAEHAGPGGQAGHAGHAGPAPSTHAVDAHHAPLTARAGRPTGASLATPAAPGRGGADGTNRSRVAYAHFIAARDAIARRDLVAAIDGFEKALAVCPGDPLIARLLEKTRAAHAKIDPAGAAALDARAASGPAMREPSGHPANAATSAALAGSSGGAGAGPSSGGPAARSLAERARKGRAATSALESHPADPGRFLMALGATPAASPAVSLDLTGSGSFKELAVSLGILVLLVAFGVLLLG